jgi:hypothetical protein
MRQALITFLLLAAALLSIGTVSCAPGGGTPAPSGGPGY